MKKLRERGRRHTIDGWLQDYSGLLYRENRKGKITYESLTNTLIYCDNGTTMFDNNLDEAYQG